MLRHRHGQGRRAAPRVMWAKQAFLAMVIASAVLLLSATNTYAEDGDDKAGQQQQQQQPPLAGQGAAAAFSDGMTPQQAYERALVLLRSTLVYPPSAGRSRQSGSGKASPQNQGQAQRSKSKQARKTASSERWPTEPVSGAALYWELIRTYIPLAGIWRDLMRLRNALAELNPFPLRQENAWPDAVERGNSIVSRFGPTLRSAGKGSWEGASLLAAPEGYGGGNDPVEEEQARLYPGARPEQLWPEWDGSDDAFFGPFYATAYGDNLDDSLGQATGLPFLGINATSLTSSSILTTAAKKRRAEEQRIAADERRDEAIGLLTWAAGYSEADSIRDKDALVRTSKSLDWRELSIKDAASEADDVLIDNFLASHNGSTFTSGRPYSDALWVLAQLSFWGTHGTAPNPARAKTCFERLAFLNGNASAHNVLGWMEGGAWGEEGWNLMGASEAPVEANNKDRQAKALIHYTSAARQGDTMAQIALAYRHHAGIGVSESCGAALAWYEKAARDALQRFQSGPPGGLILPYTHMRLSDISGGVFGPGSSAASTGLAKFRPAIQAMMHSLPAGGSSDGRRLEDLLEFFVYHAQRGSPSFAWRLARVYYGGSVLGTSESAARVRRDFGKAREYLLKITAQVWPRDAGLVRRGGPSGPAPKPGQTGEDVKLKVDDMLAAQAGLAAGLMGKMYLRGEGVRRDYSRAWVWFSRGVEQGDSEAYNGLGTMLQQGLGLPRDIKKATEYFEASASTGAMASSEGSINLGKIYLAMSDFTNAVKYFDLASKVGNSFEAYYYLALINVKIGNFAKQGDAYKVGPPGTASHERCKNAVSGFKHAVERADWKDPTFSRAERAWSKGLRGRALLGWALAGERGYEAAQNNVAWVLDRDKKRLKVDRFDPPQSNATDRLALIHWIRSAAQDNVDALVKMGDYYYYGLGLGEQGPSAHWNPKPTGTSSTPPPAPTATYDKAAACYSAAAERQTSALAYWNMGFMYERGLGVPKKDYNLAKRFYDMALDLNPSEAYLPVFLSLTKLFATAIWDVIKNQDASALSLLNGVAFGSASRARVLNAVGAGYFDAADLPYTEADEIRLQQERDEHAAIQLALQRGEDLQQDLGQAELGDLNLPETYEGGIGTHKDQQHGQGTGTEDLDDTIEGLMIVVGLAALAMLVYARQGAQNRVERHRREAEGRQRREDGAAQEAPQGDRDQGETRPQAERPPEMDRNQPFGWPLQDGNAYAGL